jgi:hypothetical protein
VEFYGYSGNVQDDEVWDKVGQAIGNLQALESLHIVPNHGEVLPPSDWEILARILSHVRQKIEVNISDVLAWNVEESRLFARAIHGHPTITSFADGLGFPYESLDALYSALATMPALESISLSGFDLETMPEDESALAHPESLTELLRVPSLRSVCFSEFDITSALCQATANALMEGTAITSLEFALCSFFAEGSASALIMANGLSRNTSVTRIKVMSTLDQALYDALAMALPLNSTLRRLDLNRDLTWQDGDVDHDLSPVFLALGKNIGLKEVSLAGFCLIDESLCTAMKDGLGMNTTLESLELKRLHLTNDNSDLWCRALSFLRTNNDLKSLKVHVYLDVAESCVVAFRTNIAAMLQENASLESISFLSWDIIQVEEYVALVTAFKHHRTLRTLHFGHSINMLTDDEDKEMAVVLKKNYALERLPNINQGGNMGAILRLNEAGRRYLIEDGSSISKGVEVLSAVSDEINCVFLHLLENPRLCDRNAVEKVSAGESNGSSTNPTAGSDAGKREGDSAHKGDASHRRLA